MPTSDATISMRIPSKMKKRLEEAARRTHRSRSYLTITALKRYLAEIEQEEQSSPKSKLEIAQMFQGAGVGAGVKPRTSKDIDDSIRDLRGDE